MKQVLELFNVEHKGRQYRCPFHNDHTPSASVKNEKFHCFACGWHGDIIDFANSMGMKTAQLAAVFGVEWDKPLTAEDKRKCAEAQRERECKAERQELLKHQINRLCACRCALWQIYRDEEQFAIKHLDGLIDRLIEPLDHDVEAHIRALWNRWGK